VVYAEYILFAYTIPYSILAPVYITDLYRAHPFIFAFTPRNTIVIICVL